VRTDRGFDRLVNFSDAVVAVALTLLIFPLTSIPSDAPKGQSVLHMLGDHSYELASFVISFLVIAMLWRAHHSLFEHLQSYNQIILRFNELWLFTIVVLPFTTELINRTHDDRTANALYLGSLLVSSICLTGITVTIRRSPDLRNPASAADPNSRIDGPPWITTALLAVAFVVVVAFPQVNQWPLLALFLAEPLRGLVVRLSDRASTSPDSGGPAAR
jgi:uncharacterized membrane protein